MSVYIAANFACTIYYKKKSTRFNGSGFLIKNTAYIWIVQNVWRFPDFITILILLYLPKQTFPDK